MSDTVKLHRIDWGELRPGDTVTRIWGNGYMTNKMRVSDMDEKFIYCDAQVDRTGEMWELPAGSEPWKFDIVYGVETDEEMGWGVAYDIVLTRIEP